MMLEILARSGPARRFAWRKGDHTVHTPLLVASAHQAVPEGAAYLLGERDAVPAEAERRGAIQIIGGFLQREPVPLDESSPVWARIETDTASIVESRLSMLHETPRAAPLPEFQDIPGTRSVGGSSQATAGPPDPQKPAGQSANGGSKTDRSQSSLGLLVVGDEEVAVAPGLAGLAGDAVRLAPRLIAAREAAGPARLLMAPGVGLVHHAALLVYAGVDLIDTLGVERASAAGYYLTSEGAHKASTLKAPLCGCATCQNVPPSEMDKDALLAHNLGALAEEQRRIVGHIENDTLRNLVEQRARAHPGTAALLRRLDRHLAHFSARWPLHNENQVLATTQESLTRADVARYRHRIREDYRPPELADVLLLLPCSARKPYARSQSHKIFRRVISDLGAASRIHEMILTSPLGVVPRELETTWPAAHYDVPVTGHWDREEVHMIRAQLKALLAKSHYKQVVSHLGEDTHALVADLLPEDTPHTAASNPTGIPSRDRLRRALQEATRGESAPAWPARRRSDAHAALTWQMGNTAADALIVETRDVSGRPPGMRIYRERGNQHPLATFVPQRGLFALTLTGARVLHEAGCALTVEIDDFTPRGTLFAVGVKAADPRIVPGDEVALVHEGQLRGVGRALCTGNEMQALPRGGAVEVRHHV